MVDTQTERELKFDVPDGFEVPDVREVAPPRRKIARSTVHLTSTYFDTADHALLRQRITVRCRQGDTDEGWHLKVPNGDARTEIRLPLGAGRAVPAKLARLVFGVALGEPLGPVAVVQTERRLHQVLDRTGATIIEVAADQVRATALGADARVTEWHELEVELGTGDEDLLAAFATHLERAGATVSASRSKLAHALGEPGEDTSDDPAREAVRSYLTDQFAALTAGDVALRRGLEPVHKTRVAARRTRSILRVFGPVLEGNEAQWLDGELSWYQDLLGEVRDRQVQRARLAAAVTALPDELALGPVAAQIEQTLLGEERLAVQDVRAALDSERYLDLLRRARSFATDPPLVSGTSKRDLRERADQARRTAAKQLAKATDNGIEPELLHRARKATKRARYAAELMAPLSGRATARVVERCAQAQEILGSHQDAVLAADNLRRIGTAAGTRRGHNGFTYGLLFARQHAEQERLRAMAAKLRL